MKLWRKLVQNKQFKYFKQWLHDKEIINDRELEALSVNNLKNMHPDFVKSLKEGFNNKYLEYWIPYCNELLDKIKEETKKYPQGTIVKSALYEYREVTEKWLEKQKAKLEERKNAK